MLATHSVAQQHVPSYVGVQTPGAVTPDVLGLLRTPHMSNEDDAERDAERKRRVGRRIRELREGSVYTQEAVAKRIGVSLRGYQAMEEKGAASFPSLQKIAAVHDVDVSYFQEGVNGDRLDEAITLLRETHALMREIATRLDAVVPPLSEADALQAAKQVVADAEKARRAPKRGTAKRAPSSRGSRPA